MSEPPLTRVSELIGAPVYGPDGERIGVVEDVRLAQDGPPQGHLHTRIRVAGLIVAPRRHVRLWGYERRPDIGPWLIRAIVRRLSHGAHGVRWADVRWDPVAGVVHCRLPKRALSAAYDLPATP